MNLCGVVQYIDTAAPELQLIECALYAISSKADRGDIFIPRSKILISHTPTLGRNRRPGAPDQKGTLASDLKGAGKDFSLKCI